MVSPSVTAPSNLLKQFSLNDCKGALADVLLAFKLPENASRLDEAQNAAGNDMLKSMQVFFPIATEIEMEVIEKYGFPKDGDGLIRFTQAVKVYASQDTDVAAMSANLRAILMPTVTTYLTSNDQVT